MEDKEAEEAVETEFRGKDDEKLMKRLAHLERKMNLVEGALGEKGKELDKEKLMRIQTKDLRISKNNLLTSRQK